MVEMIDYGTSRTTKLKRDIKKLLRLRREAVADLKAAGQWRGGARTRGLALINWYQAQNNCGHCVNHPNTSFSTRVHRATEQRGVLAGAREFVRLWARRTQGHLV